MSDMLLKSHKFVAVSFFNLYRANVGKIEETRNPNNISEVENASSAPND